MPYLIDALRIVVEVLFGLATGLVVIRVLLQALRCDFYNPISQALYRLTNPVLMPLRRLLPPLGRVDSAGVALAWLLQVLKLLVFALLVGVMPGLLTLLLLGLTGLIDLVIGLYFWLILARVVLGFVGAAPRQPAVPLLMQLTEPLLRPLRRLIPDLGGIDLTPMLATLALYLLRPLLVAPLRDLALALG